MGFFFENDKDDMYDYIPGVYIYGDDTYVPDEYMDEKWWYTDVPGYMISNMGRVWSEKKQKFLSVKKMDKHGHKGVCLSYQGKSYYYYIHRLMAKAFIPNPDSYPYVLHEDDDPTYNELPNLRWGTQRHNYEDCVRNGHFYNMTKEERQMGIDIQKTPILATHTVTGEQMRFESQREAADKLGLQQSNVWKVLNGQRWHTGRWTFEYLPKD